MSADQAAKITKHEIQQPTGTTVNTLVLGVNGQLVITEYVELDGDTQAATVAGVTYKSSNPSVVVVNASGELIPLAEGTANITISKEGLEDYVVPVTVKADAREASTLTGLSNLSLSVSNAGVNEDKNVTVVVKDQYEDLVTGKDLTVTSSDASVAVVTLPDTDSETTGDQFATNAEGKATFNVKALKAGTTTITVKAGDKVIGTATVTVKAAGTVASYDLETVAADLTLDLNTDLETADNALQFGFVSRDTAGLLIEKLTVDGSTYTVTSSNPAVATVNNSLEVTAVGTGTTTITVKEGTITRATKTITVVDTTPPAVTTGLESGPFANFTLGNAEDDDATTFTLTYTDAQQSIGDAPALTFVNPVKLASIAIDGTQLTDELIYELVAKSGTNFVTAYTNTIDLGNIGTKIADLVELGNVITVKFVNEAGYDEEYTFTLVASAEEVAPEDGEEA